MQWLGGQLVYGFPLIARGCGLIGPNAAAVVGRRAFWMTQEGNFWMYMDGAADEILCPLKRDVFDNLNDTQKEKIFCTALQRFSEVWWFYPDARDGGAEVSRYVVYNWQNGSWSCGTFDRTAWIDAGVLPFPLAASSAGTLYYQERGQTADGEAITALLRSAEFDLGDGATLMQWNGIRPDIEDIVGGFRVTVFGRIEAQGTQYTEGPFDVNGTTTTVDFMFTARQAGLLIESDSLPSFWRLGTLRFDLIETQAVQ
jgi:hypothetical protein